MTENWGTQRFCLATSTIGVPQINSIDSLAGMGTRIVYLSSARRPACILKPKENTDQFELLKMMAERFDIESEIHVHAAKSIKTLEIVMDLISPIPRALTHERISGNLAECLEAYCSCIDTDRLRDLLYLLRLPEPDRSPNLPLVA